MSPEVALHVQISAYKSMSPDDRLRIALQLADLTIRIARDGIRHQQPLASEVTIDREIRRRVELAC